MSWRTPSVLLLLAVAACDDPATVKGGKAQVADYVGVPGTRLTYAPADALDDPPLLLHLGAESWESRDGASWDEATLRATWPVVLTDSLTVDGTALLGPALPDSASVETQYGTFPDAVAAEPNGGAFAGRWVFAADLGPIVLTIEGVERECVYYERDVDDDTAAE